jgi:hypothetical protein
MIQLIGFALTFNNSFYVFNGNLKIDRLIFDIYGRDSFIHNGNLLVIKEGYKPIASKITP